MTYFNTASSSNAGDIAVRLGASANMDAVFIANAKRLALPRTMSTPYSKFLQAYAVVPTPEGMHRGVFTSNAWKELTPAQQDHYGATNAAKAQAKAAKASERAATKAAKVAERETAKATKDAAREAVKATKDAAREAVKAQAKTTKAAEREAAKAQAKATKAAEREAAKAQAKATKAAEREANKAQAKATKAAEREAAKATKAAEREAAKALIKLNKPKKAPCSFILYLNATRAAHTAILAEVHADGAPVQSKEVTALAGDVWRDDDSAELRDLWADRANLAKNSEFSDRSRLIASWVESV